MYLLIFIIYVLLFFLIIIIKEICVILQLGSIFIKIFYYDFFGKIFLNTIYCTEFNICNVLFLICFSSSEIPQYRLPYDVVQFEIDLIRNLDVKFVTGRKLSAKDITVDVST